MSLDTLVQCSLISTPGALVLIGLKSPAPLLWGLRSSVSLWLGPPSIQRRTQCLALAFGLVRVSAARADRTSIHPEAEAPNTPAADRPRKSRRGRSRRVRKNRARSAVSRAAKRSASRGCLGNPGAPRGPPAGRAPLARRG